MTLMYLSELGGLNTLTAIAARFWSLVEKGPGFGDCWLWAGGIDGDGYGKFTAGGIRFTAHRFSFLLEHGVIDQDLLVCHSCDTPGCVNPAHHWQGTTADNMADMWAKRRARAGAPAPPRPPRPPRPERPASPRRPRKLRPRSPDEHVKRPATPDDLVREIYTLYKSGIAQNELSRRFDLHRGTIFDIVRKRTRADITDLLD